MQETWVQSLGQEDSLEMEMAPKSHGQKSLADYTVHGVTKEPAMT